MVSHSQYLTLEEQEAVQELANAREQIARLEAELAAARERANKARAKLAGLAVAEAGLDTRPVQVFISARAMAYLNDAELSDAASAALGAAPSRPQGFGKSYVVKAARPVLAEMLARLEETQTALRLENARAHRNDINNLTAVIDRLREKIG